MLVKILYRVLIALALVFTVILAALGLFVHMEVYFASMAEALIRVSGHPIKAIAFAFILLAINTLIVAAFYINANDKKMRRFHLSVFCTAAICSVLGAIWVKEYSYNLVGDQKDVWDAATLLAQYKGEEADLVYFKVYPQQKIMCLAMTFFVKAFRDNGLIAFRVFSWLCAVLVVFFGACLAYRLSGREEAGTATAIMLTEFVSITLYSTYIYGTLPSLCFTLMSFYAVTLLIQTKKPIWLFAELLSCALMYTFYTGTLIAMVAIAIILIVFSIFSLLNKDKNATVTAIIGAILPFLLAGGIRVVAGEVFYLKTGLSPKEDSLPASTWVRMGLTSNAGIGPGGYDGSHEILFAENDFNEERTDAIAKENIRKAMEDYLDGKRSMKFFWHKTETQWLDPWFGGLTMNVYSLEPAKVGLLTPFFTPQTLGRVQRCLLALMNVCYCMASLYLILQIRNKKPRLETLLLPLYFVGGFVFQLFWETKGRYCFPYYVCLLILAGIATASLEQFLVRRYEAMRDRKKLKERASAQLSKKTK